MSKLYVVLLAGGVGSRLAPLSTPDHPKQFLTLPGQGETLLQQAARTALKLVPASQVITLTAASFHTKAATLLRDVDAGLLEHLLVEPKGAGTAAAATVAALYAREQQRDACLLLLPCDHDRRMPLDLADLLPQILALSQEHIVTFGVQPESADTGFGYLLADKGGQDIKVNRFIEKPSELMAGALLETGQAWWNSGMFGIRAAAFLSRMQALDPHTHAACKVALGQSEGGKLGAAYTQVAGASIDVTVMERSDNLVLLPIDGGWADIGTWPRLLCWWQAHAPEINEWDFGSGEPIHYDTARRYSAA